MYNDPKSGIEFFSDNAFFIDYETKMRIRKDVRHTCRYFCFRIGEDHRFQMFRDRFLDDTALDMLEKAKENFLRLTLRGYIIPHRIDGLFKCDLIQFGVYAGETPPDFYELRGELWYEYYLASDEWKRKREAVLKRDGCCMGCGSTMSLVVHHYTYKRVGNEELADLITLCRRCHH